MRWTPADPGGALKSRSGRPFSVLDLNQNWFSLHRRRNLGAVLRQKHVDLRAHSEFRQVDAGLY